MKPKTRPQDAAQDESNVLPVMNIMLLLIPALLLSMEFAALAQITVSPPHFTVDNTKSPEPQKDEASALVVRVRSDGFTLALETGAGTIDQPSIGLAQPGLGMSDPGRWDLDELSRQVAGLRPLLSEGASIEIGAEGDIVMQVLVSTIDAIQDPNDPMPLIVSSEG